MLGFQFVTSISTMSKRQIGRQQADGTVDPGVSPPTHYRTWDHEEDWWSDWIPLSKRWKRISSGDKPLPPPPPEEEKPWWRRLAAFPPVMPHYYSGGVVMPSSTWKMFEEVFFPPRELPPPPLPAHPSYRRRSLPTVHTYPPEYRQ